LVIVQKFVETNLGGREQGGHDPQKPPSGSCDHTSRTGSKFSYYGSVLKEMHIWLTSYSLLIVNLYTCRAYIHTQVHTQISSTFLCIRQYNFISFHFTEMVP
jgi:hypothetical protein